VVAGGEGREIAGGEDVAVPGNAEDAAEVEEFGEREFEFRVLEVDADHDAGAGEVAAPEGGFEGFGFADDLEGDVDAVAAGDLLDFRDRIAVARVDGVGGAELLGPLEFLGIDVDADDGRGAGDL